MSETTETFEPKDEEMEADTSSSEEYADFDLNQTLEYDVPEKRDFLGRRWLAKDEWADRMRAVYLYKTSGALPRQARKRSYIKELSKNFSALKGHLYKKKMVRGIRKYYFPHFSLFLSEVSLFMHFILKNYIFYLFFLCCPCRPLCRNIRPRVNMAADKLARFSLQNGVFLAVSSCFQRHSTSVH